MEKRFQSYSSIEDIDSPDLTFQEKIISYWESYEPYIRIDRWNSDVNDCFLSFLSVFHPNLICIELEIVLLARNLNTFHCSRES